MIAPMNRDAPSSPLRKAIADDIRVDRQAYWVIVAVTLGFMVVNAFTFIADYARIGEALDPRLPWIYEISSAAVLLALVPAFGWLTRRFPLPGEDWKITVPVYAASLAVFSAVHIAGMVLLRKLTFAALGVGPYIFAEGQGRLLEEAVYEFRKDTLTFILFTTFLSLWRRLAELKREAQAARADARATQRLTLKSGGRTFFLDASAVEWAKAAGNYVEIAAGGKTHLARMTMAALETQLEEAGADTVRAHRSWIVSRDRIEEIVPSGDGDVTVKLAGGVEVPGSRRYRDRLAAQPTGD
ncbi:MAG: LytTR family DNA-binding domain-containing protein [Amphiplicatus sp.]